MTPPKITLTQEDVIKIVDIAESIVKNTVLDYNEHLTVHNGIVDEHRWKKIKEREDIRVYRERSPSLDGATTGAPLRGTGSPSSNNNNTNIETGSENTDDFKTVAPMLAFGSIEGRLDDVMYGTINQSSEAMQIKSAYVEDGFVDWELLAPIITPSERDPYRELSVKRHVKDHPLAAKAHSLLVGAVMRQRSAVYIESVGMAQSPNGERIGYILRHSVDVPGIREMPGLILLFAKISFCYIFRQRRANCVEVFVRGVLDPMGEVPVSLIALTGAEVVLAVGRNTHCAEMKKLTRILSCQPTTVRALVSSSSSASGGGNSSTGEVDDDEDDVTPTTSAERQTSCGQCRKSIATKLKVLRSSSKEKSCAMCGSRLCASCRVHKTLFTPSATKEKELTQRTRAFCTSCLACVIGASSATFAALDARAAQGEHVDYMSALNLSTSRRWDFPE